MRRWSSLRWPHSLDDALQTCQAAVDVACAPWSAARFVICGNGPRCRILLLDQLHSAQNEFYGGGGDERLRSLLTPDVAWIVPGQNSIAGEYVGHRRGLRLLSAPIAAIEQWNLPDDSA